MLLRLYLPIKDVKKVVSRCLCVFLFIALTFSFIQPAFSQEKDLDKAEALNQQVNELYSQGRYEEAIKVAQQVLTILENVLGPDHPEVATSLDNLAGLYISLDDYAMAEPLLKRALAIRDKALGPEHPDVAASLSSIAFLYDSLGDYAKAEPLYKRALDIREKALGPEHPDLALSERCQDIDNPTMPRHR